MIKKLIIDATNYPLIKVAKPLSMRGVLSNEVIYGNEEMETHLEFYDYQPEDLKGGEDQWQKDHKERESCWPNLLVINV